MIAGERRVALSPQATAALVKKGFSVNVETGAGAQASFKDEDFAKAGAKIVDSDKAFKSDVVLKVCLFSFIRDIFNKVTSILHENF